MATKKYDFTGKVALVTGSSSGIGAAIVEQFARYGAKVVITGHVAEDVEQMAQHITSIAGGERPLTLVGSLLDDEFAEKLVHDTVQRYGRIDVLVNNAGRLCEDGTFNDPKLMEKYDQVMNLNVRSLFKMIHLTVPHLAVTKGNIVNMASIAGFVPCVNAVYSTSKAAVNMLTKTAALDLYTKGIRVNSVNPGPIRTNLGTSMNDPDAFHTETNPLLPHTVMKRYGEPAEVANMVLFLASNDDASYITGVNNVIDGGYMCL